MTINPDKLLNLTESLRNEDKTGILLVDKSTGMTSHDVVAITRKKLDVKRVGHAGTLDPLATGLLVVLVGREYTKKQSIFLKQDKEYLCTARLGVTTDSFDVDGEVVEQTLWPQLSKISQKNVEKVLLTFVGKSKQAVPIFSAVKVKGQKLYNLARQNKKDVDVELPVRQVSITNLELLDFIQDKNAQKVSFTFRTTVSSGTYIRSLVSDIGKALQVGATVSSLRRTKIANLDVKNALRIEQI